MSSNVSDTSIFPLSGISAWFPTIRNEEYGWRLDAVTLLAVIGESAIAENGQTLTATPFCLIPRIIPAPQALLQAARPPRLPSVPARMSGVYSGVDLHSVGFFANIIHPLEELPPFAFRVMEIRHTNKNAIGNKVAPDMIKSKSRNQEVNGQNRGATLANFSARWGLRRGYFDARSRNEQGGETVTEDPSIPIAPPRVEGSVIANDDDKGTAASSISVTTKNRTQTINFEENSNMDVEAGVTVPSLNRQVIRRTTLNEFVTNPTLANNAERPAVPAQALSPIHILSVFSFVLTIAGVVLAAQWKDGVAIVALCTVSLACSVVGYASWWKPMLMSRSHINDVPHGDVVIRTRSGAFLLVKCTEDVARELYSGTEECAYHIADGRIHRALMALGTLLIMLAVVLLGNCRWNSQVYIGASYILLNGLYWGMGMLPARWFWDLSRYECKDVTPSDAINADKVTHPDDPREGKNSFTRTMWYAIRETKSARWCLKSGAAPDTEQWQRWLDEAEQHAKRGERDWKAVTRKGELMREQLRKERRENEELGVGDLPTSYDPMDGGDSEEREVIPFGQQVPAQQIRGRGTGKRIVEGKL